MLTYMRSFVMKNRENNARKYIGKIAAVTASFRDGI